MSALRPRPVPGVTDATSSRVPACHQGTADRMGTIQKDRILQFRGEDLCDRSGDKLGTIEEIYLDAETNEPEWALIHTGLFGTKRTFVPLRDAQERDGSLSVPFEKSTVK